MKFLSIVTMFLMSSSIWAANLNLNCTINKTMIILDVESLVSNGCESGILEHNLGAVKARYNVTLCNGKSAEGTLEVHTQNGWQPVEDFSTDKNCRLYRPIQTRPNPCDRYGHQC